jgi:hypothetical protein
MPASPELQRAKFITEHTSVGKPDTSAVTVKVSDQPDTYAPEYLAMQPDWELMTDVMSGTRHVRMKREKYLPKSPAENMQEYEDRLVRSEFFNGTERTLDGLVGMAFRRDPVLEDDVPPELDVAWEDIDLAGSHGDVFAAEAFADGLTYGHVGIFVDAPDTGGRVYDLVTEAELGIRPYWCKIKPDQIVNWRFSRIGGKMVLTQLVLRFCTQVPDGVFGSKDVEEFRVYRRLERMAYDAAYQEAADYRPGNSSSVVTWEVWERTTQAAALTMNRSGVLTSQVDIPFALAIMGRKKGLLFTRPPLLDLAYTNIAHYRVQSDHRYSLHKASVPLLVFKNRTKSEGSEVVIGPNVGIDVGPDGDVKYVEHAGSALGQTRQEMRDLEMRMRTLGLTMLQPGGGWSGRGRIQHWRVAFGRFRIASSSAGSFTCSITTRTRAARSPSIATSRI